MKTSKKGTAPKIAPRNLKARIQSHLINPVTFWSSPDVKIEGSKEWMFAKEVLTIFNPDGQEVVCYDSYMATFIYRAQRVRGHTSLCREVLQISCLREEAKSTNSTRLNYIISQLFDKKGNITRCFESTSTLDNLFERYQDRNGIDTIHKIELNAGTRGASYLTFGVTNDIESLEWCDNPTTLTIMQLSSSTITYEMRCARPFSATDDMNHPGTSLEFGNHPKEDGTIFSLRKGIFSPNPLSDGTCRIAFQGGEFATYTHLGSLDTGVLSDDEKSNFLEQCTLNQQREPITIKKTFGWVGGLNPQGIFIGPYEHHSLEQTFTATFDDHGEQIGVAYHYDRCSKTPGYQIMKNNNKFRLSFSQTQMTPYINDVEVTYQLDLFIIEILNTPLYRVLMKKIPLELLSHVAQIFKLAPEKIFGEHIGPIEGDNSDELLKFAIFPGVQHWKHYFPLFQSVTQYFHEKNSDTPPNTLCLALDYLQRLLPLLFDNNPIPVSFFHEDLFKKTFETSIPILQTDMFHKSPRSSNINQAIRQQLITELKPHLAWIMRRLELILKYSDERADLYNEILQLPTIMLKLQEDEIRAMKEDERNSRDPMEKDERNARDILACEYPLMTAATDALPIVKAEQSMYELLLRYHRHILKINQTAERESIRKHDLMKKVVSDRESFTQSKIDLLTDAEHQGKFLFKQEETAITKMFKSELNERKMQLEKEEAARKQQAIQLHAHIQKKLGLYQQSHTDAQKGTCRDETTERKALLRLFFEEKKSASINYTKTRENVIHEESQAYASLSLHAQFLKQYADETRQRKQIEAEQSNKKSFFKQLHRVEDERASEHKKIVSLYHDQEHRLHLYVNQLHKIDRYQKQPLSIKHLIDKLPESLLTVLLLPLSLHDVTLDLYRIEIAQFLKNKRFVLDTETQELMDTQGVLQARLSKERPTYFRETLQPVLKMVEPSWLFLLKGMAFSPEEIRSDTENCISPRLSHITNRNALFEYFCCSVFELCHRHNIPILLMNNSPEDTTYLDPDALAIRKNSFCKILTDELASSTLKGTRFFRSWEVCKKTLEEGASTYLETLADGLNPQPKMSFCI